jgi:hypothetical protein
MIGFRKALPVAALQAIAWTAQVQAAPVAPFAGVKPGSATAEAQYGGYGYGYGHCRWVKRKIWTGYGWRWRRVRICH